MRIKRDYYITWNSHLLVTIHFLWTCPNVRGNKSTRRLYFFFFLLKDRRFISNVIPNIWIGNEPVYHRQSIRRINRTQVDHLYRKRSFTIDWYIQTLSNELFWNFLLRLITHADENGAKLWKCLFVFCLSFAIQIVYTIQTLRFDGFYFEDSVAWGYSRRTVHPVKFCYYLEDDTISVHEPVTPVRLFTLLFL